LNPQFRLWIEGFRSVLHVPMHPLDKMLCFATGAAASCERPLRNLAGKWRDRLKSRASGRQDLDPAGSVRNAPPS